MEFRTRTNYSTVLILFGLLIGELVILPMRVRGNAEFSIEGLGCDSCGKDCSAVCGSRQFRSCCFNYIKKRSGSPANPNINSNLISQSSLSSFGMGATELDPSSSTSSLASSSSSSLPSSSSSSSSLGVNGRKHKANKIDRNQNENHEGGGGGSMDMDDLEEQQIHSQFFPTVPFPGGGIITTTSRTSPIIFGMNPSKNWNSRVFLVTETEIPDRLIRRYLSSSSLPLSSASSSSSSGSGSGNGMDTGIERLMRNRLLSTSSASVPSSKWISLPDEIGKNMFEH